MATVRDELREEIRRSAEETRRHFDVVSEALRSQIQLLAAGVLTVTRDHERFRVVTDERFRVVDDRLLRLEARVFGSPDR